MNYWRNTSRTSFDADGEGQRRLNEALAEMTEDDASTLREAVETLLDALPSATGGDWPVQEVFYDGAVFRGSFVLRGVEMPILGQVVGGGIDLCIGADEVISGEYGFYFHRLVCTNGMLLPHVRDEEFRAWTLSEWKRTVGDCISLMTGPLRIGFARMQRSTRVALGDIPAMLPRLMADLRLDDEPSRDFVLKALEEEPGDRAWHLINALSAAANFLERRAGPPSSAVLVARRDLQRAAMRVLDVVSREGTRQEALAAL